MKAHYIIASVAVLFAACASESPDSVVLEWSNQSAELQVTEYTVDGGVITAYGEIAGQYFELIHERYEDSSRITVREAGSDTIWWFERGDTGQNAYSLEQAGYGPLIVQSEEADGYALPADLGELIAQREREAESGPRAELEARGISWWLVMLPEVVMQLSDLGLAVNGAAAMTHTTAGVFTTLFLAENVALWAGGTIGGCEISHNGTSCSCPAVSCFAGSTPTGVGQCTIYAQCTTVSGETEIGPVGELEGEYTSCTTFGNCLCGATCKQCRSAAGEVEGTGKVEGTTGESIEGGGSVRGN